jgi:pimeloyl-ACP methyl ester carboxylesterase
LKGTVNSLDQDGVNRPLDEVSLKDVQVRLVLKISRLVYEGTLNAAGTEIAGHFKQGGTTLPLDFKKVETLPATRKRPQEPKRPFPYNEGAVTYENAAGHAKFAGTLTWPRSPGRFPAVLLITGSGQQDRDETILGHRPFLVLSDYLTRHGIAVLRVDDRGVGGSTGDVLNATTEDFASDVLAGIAYLKTRPEIDPHRIGLMGHSEGGIIAPMVARRSPDVAFIVLLAGSGIPGEQILYLQQAAIARQMGASTPTILFNRAVEQLLLTAIKRGTDSAPADQKSKQPVDDRRGPPSKDDKKPAANEASAAVDKLAKRLGSPWLRFFISYDPRPALREVRCPVLAVIGEKDIQVPAQENLPEIEKALRAGGNKDFTVKELPHLNHLFQTCQTGNIDEYARIEETFAPSALELITDWIGKHTR